jgi:hypothetical protein
MAFWNEASLEPKRKFKFLIDFGLANEGLPSFIAKKCDKPSFEISETSHDFLGHKFYYPGKVTWKTITATVIDPAGFGAKGDGISNTIQAPPVDVARNVYKLLLRSGYQSPKNAATAVGSGGNVALLETLSKSKATTPFNQIKIKQVNDLGEAVETWTLNNAWIKDINLGNLDYAADEINEITFTFRYDWADLQAGVFDSNVTNPNTDIP